MLPTTPNHPPAQPDRVLAWAVNVPVSVVLLVAAGNWVGWATGGEKVMQALSSSPLMVPWTALCLAALGLAIVLQTDRSSRARAWLGSGLAVVVGVLVLLFLVEYATDSSFSLEEVWLSPPVRNLQPDWPGRPSHRTVWSVLPLAIAVAVMRVDRRWVRRVWQLCLFGAVVTPVITGTGYLFAAGSLVHTPGVTSEAITTTMCLLLLVAAALAARPDRNPIAWILARPDHRALVRLLGILAGLPLFVGLSRFTLMTVGLREDSAWALGTVSGALVVGLAGFFLSQREQALLRERAEADAHYRILAYNSVDIVSHLRDGEIVWTSPSAEPAFGWPAEQWTGTDFLPRIHPDDLDTVVTALQEIATSGSTMAQFRLVAADGSYHWVESHGKPYLDAAGNPDGLITSSRIIDDRVEAEQRLERLARIDTLTGLSNRGETISRLVSALTCGRNPGTETGVLFCDVDSFKAVNDTFGHGVGDAVLSTLADRICQCVRHGDTVGRTGGDEMLVLLPGLHSLEEAAQIAKKILARAAEPIHHSGHTIRATLSIGATLAVSGEPVSDTTTRADAAMYQAKHAGGNTFSLIEGPDNG